jgi:hypothetical protein
MIISKLEKTLTGFVGVIALTTPLFFRNTAPHTSAERILGPTLPLINNANVTPYIGNLPETFSFCSAAGLVGDYIESVGFAKNNKLLKTIGNYFPEITAGLTSTYFAVGETILPQILPGTADGRDVPWTILGALLGYTLAKIGRKSGFNERVYSSIKRINETLEGGKNER